RRWRPGQAGSAGRPAANGAPSPAVPADGAASTSPGPAPVRPRDGTGCLVGGSRFPPQPTVPPNERAAPGPGCRSILSGSLTTGQAALLSAATGSAGRCKTKLDSLEPVSITPSE